MCIGVTIVCLPPSVAISGYLFWYQGQKLILSYHYQRSYIAQDEIPNQSFTSYIVGLGTLGGAYYMQSLSFAWIEGGTLVGKELKKHALTMTHKDHFIEDTTKTKSIKNNMNSNKQYTTYKNYQREGIPTQGRFIPPKNMMELAKRVAPPITLRIAASSIAFFCAGCVQTYIALK